MALKSAMSLYRENFKRSLLKAFSYRIIIIIADFMALYLFTGKTDIALEFVLISNIYTTFFYFVHERLWDRIGWGKFRA